MTHVQKGCLDMSSRREKALKAIAVFVAFSIAQVYVQIGFAEPGSPNGAVPVPQQFIARLTTRGNQPININGVSAATGATVLTGATIETPADVGATINLGPLGSLDIAPNTKLRLDFDQNGRVKITLIVGCIILRTKKKAAGEVDTEQGTAGKTDSKKGGILDVCFPPGASSPVVGQAAAAAAGAGAVSTAAAGAGGLFGLGTAATVLIIGGIGAGIAIPLAINRGGNPSGSTP